MIRYVCLSDLHLADRDSVLSHFSEPGENATPRPSDVFEQLVICLRALVAGQERPPTLIVNGDFLDLAFGSVRNALTVFERCAALMREHGGDLFDEIIYLPGNHDHHLWESARETKYRREVLSRHHEDGLPRMGHSTAPFVGAAVPSVLLNDVLRHLPANAGQPVDDERVKIVYPNLLLHDRGLDRAVLLHHGHFVEPLYRLFSSGRRWLFPDRPPAQTVDDVEAENFAWIEFVWSLLGRSGEAGADVETLFEMLRYPKRVQGFSADLAARTARVLRLPFLPFVAARRVVLRLVFARMARGLSGERTRRADVCSPKAMRGIQDYLFGPSFGQLRQEIGEIPADLTFVFGHTHKPFEKILQAPGGGPVTLVNSGGWTVDTAAASPLFGASIVLIGHDLEVASLRVYNDAPGGGEAALTIQQVGEGAPGPLARWLDERMQSGDRKLWTKLIERVMVAIQDRRLRHRKRYGGSRRSSP